MSQYLNLKPVDYDKLSPKAKAKVQWKGRKLLPKYDGCFMMVGFWDGKPDFILSRTGEVVKSCDHIPDDIIKRYPKLSGVKGGKVLLGEAWRAGTDFAVLSGEFRRQRAQLALGFAVFDIVDYTIGSNDLPNLFSPFTYAERLGLLEQCERYVGGNCFPPLSVDCEDEAHAWRYARTLKAMGGYDGAVAGDPYANYVPGSGSAGEFLKVKPLLSFTLEVTGFEQDVGAKTGRPTGALVVRFKNTTCKVATGLTEDEQANLRQFVGKLIEVQCMGVYPGDDGLMREPRFVGVRDDVTKADY